MKTHKKKHKQLLSFMHLIALSILIAFSVNGKLVANQLNSRKQESSVLMPYKTSYNQRSYNSVTVFVKQYIQRIRTAYSNWNIMNRFKSSSFSLAILAPFISTSNQVMAKAESLRTQAVCAFLATDKTSDTINAHTFLGAYSVIVEKTATYITQANKFTDRFQDKNNPELMPVFIDMLKQEQINLSEIKHLLVRATDLNGATEEQAVKITEITKDILADFDTTLDRLIKLFEKMWSKKSLCITELNTLQGDVEKTLKTTIGKLALIKNCTASLNNTKLTQQIVGLGEYLTKELQKADLEKRNTNLFTRGMNAMAFLNKRLGK